MDRSNASDERTEEIVVGIDIWMLRDNLKLSYEQRIEQHQNTLDCIDELKRLRAGRAESSRTSQVSR